MNFIKKGLRKMEKQRNTQMMVILVLAVAVLTMSVGFAAYSTTLSINGTANVSAANWDVNFDTTTFAESSTVKATTKNITGTNVTYTVALAKPGDYYEFTIDVKNLGTFNANLTDVTLTALTVEQSKYLTYKLSYNGTDYSSTATGLSVPLAAKTGVETVTVRVEYVAPENPADLPASDVELSLTASLTYKQVA